MRRNTIPAAGGAAKHRRLALVASLAASLGASLPAAAQTAEPPAIGLELNKLEPQDKSCRAYLLVTNATAAAFTTLKLDLAILRKDGTIDRRIAFDLGPVRPDKRSVKLFDLANTPCDQVGSLLVNDVMECKAGDAAVKDCLDRLKLSSRVPGVDLGR